MKPAKFMIKMENTKEVIDTFKGLSETGGKIQQSNMIIIRDHRS
jgi:hypothetical protein